MCLSLTLVIVHLISLEMPLVPVLFFNGWVCACVQYISCSGTSLSCPGLMEVLENEVNSFFPPLPFPVVQLLILSALSFYISMILWFYLLFYSFFSFLLSFFPQIAELGPGCLDQCHHSGWQRGWAQRFPGRLNGLCGCLSSFWVFSHWLSPHLSGELTKSRRLKHERDTYMNQLSTTNKIWHWACSPGRLVSDYNSSVFIIVAQMIK